MSFSVTILGCSSATPTSRRNQSSQVVEVSGSLFLIDCGEGTQMQLRRYRIRFQKIHHIFISHLHGDHYLGLMGLLLTMHLFGKTSIVKIFGPANLKPIILEQLKYTDSYINYELVFIEVGYNEKELIFENDKVEVYSFPLDHGISCTGYLFKEKEQERRLNKEKAAKFNLSIEDIVNVKRGNNVFSKDGVELSYEDFSFPSKVPRSYAYCSDTAYKEDLIPILKNVDLLYHEATFMHDMKDRAKKTKHSTAKQAASIAKKAKVEKLILGHFSARYRELTPLLEEAKEVFSNTILGEDGAKFEIC
ncbi:MAG: ribonuclease Z [Flavobacteriales bacterium]|nr:ribonuclease Z [Flavobacteriales bacterium]